MTRLNSLRARVLLTYVAGAALSIVIVVLVAAAIVSSHGEILSGLDVAERTEQLAAMLQFDGQGVPVGFSYSENDLASWLYDSLRQETAYRVLDASGRVVLSSAAGAAFWPASGAGRRPEPGRFEFQHEGVAMRGATEEVQRDGKTWYLQFAVSERFMDLMYHFALPLIQTGIMVFSLVLLFVFGTSAYVTLRYALKPLKQLSESASAISTRALHARLDTMTAPTEIAPLVDSFNRVLGRLELGFRTQQEFLATAAHELKTPLALIRAQVEFMEPDDQRSSLLKDVGHMSRQVQQLLLLAEASEVQSYRPTVVDVREVAEDAVSYLQRMADAAGVSLATPDRAMQVQWRADRGALFTLLKNLLENAIEHAPRGTEVRVEISADSVSVCDRGPGVSQEQLSLMFSRFWRGAHRRDHGAGLGLAICQEIALAHGWTLSGQRMEPGLRLRLSRPGTEQETPMFSSRFGPSDPGP